MKRKAWVSVLSTIGFCTVFSYGAFAAAQDFQILDSPDSFAQYQLAGDYNLLVQTEPDTVSVYQADGSVLCQLPGRLAYSTQQLAKAGEGIVIWDDSSNSGRIYRTGDTELSAASFSYLDPLSETVLTDCDPFQDAAGFLYDANGEKLSEEQSLFQRFGDRIVSYEAVYDLTGERLQTHPVFQPLAILDNRIVGYQSENDCYLMYDMNTQEPLWQLENASFVSLCNGWINWTSSSGEGFLTDLEASVHLQEEAWKQQNAAWEITGNGMQLLCADADSGNCILRLQEANETADYLCDASFQVLEQLPTGHISLLYQDSQPIPVVWSFTEAGELLLEQLWSKEKTSISIGTEYGIPSSISLTKAADVWGITVFFEEKSESLGLIVCEEEILFRVFGLVSGAHVSQREDGIIEACRNSIVQTEIAYLIP